MRFPGCLGPILGLIVVFSPTHVLSDPSYFRINQPAKGAEWVMGDTNYASWTMGLGQGIDSFDVELARLSTDGLLFVARNVPSSASSLPITLADVPPADDYFLLFLNSTHGVMYSMSQRFTVLPAGQSAANATAGKQPPVPKGQQLLATVSVSGSPNPTSSFAYTFAPTAGAAPSRQAWSVGMVVTGVLACLCAVW